MKASVYVFVVTRQIPSKSEKGKMELYEEVSLNYKQPKRLVESATFILDIANQELVKNRYKYSHEGQYDFDNVLEYLVARHENVRELVEAYKTVSEQIAVIEAALEGTEEEAAEKLKALMDSQDSPEASTEE